MIEKVEWNCDNLAATLIDCEMARNLNRNSFLCYLFFRMNDSSKTVNYQELNMNGDWRSIWSGVSGRSLPM